MVAMALRRVLLVALVPVTILLLALVGSRSTGERPDSPAPTSIGSADWALGLLDGLPVDDERAPESSPYERDDYDRWIDQDGNCRNTRHEVLIAESLDAVTFTDERQCTVATGRWIDPYSGDEMLTTEEASIDHVVSLSEAHDAGAWRWTAEWKQALFNDLEDPATLAVSLVSVNQSKGSGGPQVWLPEPAEVRCSYLVARVRIKARWHLSVSTPEQEVTRRELEDCADAGLPSDPVVRPLVLIDFDDDPPTDTEPPPAITPGTCDDRYPDVCIPLSDDDLDCADISPRAFPVAGEDPHRFDGDGNGLGCERP